jgi:hypothetical protein
MIGYNIHVNRQGESTNTKFKLGDSAADDLQVNVAKSEAMT